MRLHILTSLFFPWVSLQKRREEISLPRSYLSLSSYTFGLLVLSRRAPDILIIHNLLYIQEYPLVTLIALLSMCKCSWFEYYLATPLSDSLATVSPLSNFLLLSFLWQLEASLLFVSNVMTAFGFGQRNPEEFRSWSFCCSGLARDCWRTHQWQPARILRRCLSATDRKWLTALASWRWEEAVWSAHAGTD